MKFSVCQLSRTGGRPKIEDRVGYYVLYSCLGSPTDPVLDAGGPLPLLPGDKLLLGSAGLWGGLADADLLHPLSQ